MRFKQVCGCRTATVDECTYVLLCWLSGFWYYRIRVDDVRWCRICIRMRVCFNCARPEKYERHGEYGTKLIQTIIIMNGLGKSQFRADFCEMSTKLKCFFLTFPCHRYGHKSLDTKLSRRWSHKYFQKIPFPRELFCNRFFPVNLFKPFVSRSH